MSCTGFTIYRRSECFVFPVSNSQELVEDVHQKGGLITESVKFAKDQRSITAAEFYQDMAQLPEESPIQQSHFNFVSYIPHTNLKIQQRGEIIRVRKSCRQWGDENIAPFAGTFLAVILAISIIASHRLINNN